jgi:2-C-methyl-D-erythritol 4-phosphate cytidylyltransferase
MKCSVVVPAAGSGSRFGGDVPKQFVPLAGRPVLAHTLLQLESFDEVGDIVVVAARHDLDALSSIIAEHGLEKCRVVEGGATRAESVLNGLAALSDTSDDRPVAIHDAVRPFLSRSLFVRLLDALRGHDGSFPGLPPTDTIHVIDGGCVSESPARNRLAGAQTPQCFRIGVVRRALEDALRSGFHPTDDVSAVVRCGGKVAMVEGDADNLKITRPEDLERAQRVLAGRRD